MSASKTRVRATAGLAAAAGAVAILLVTPTTAAVYQDVTHARSKAVTVAAVPEVITGLALNSRMVDTGVGLSADGDVYIWGYIGEGGTIAGKAQSSGTSFPPQKVPISDPIAQVSGQIYNLNALTRTGQVYGWGYQGALGLNERDGTDAPLPGYTPQKIRINGAWNSSEPLLDKILAISTSEYAGAGIRQDGTVWAWGYYDYGGNTEKGATKLAGLPDPSATGNRPVYIKGAYNGIFVILANGDTYYWGASINASTPGDVGSTPGNATRVSSLDRWSKGRVTAGSPYVVAVDGGIDMGAAILSDGTVLSWSHNNTATRIGARGTSDAPANRPGKVPTLSGITSMQFGFTGVLFGKKDGSLWGYGAGDDTLYGGLGTTPAKVSDDVVQYSSGQGYYLWQTKDGRFWGRGYNPRGAIGLPVGTGIPVRVVSYDLSMLKK